MFVEVPSYDAILFRRTYADLALPEALIDRSKQWLMDTDASWHEQQKRWDFPSGASLSFGYLQYEDDKYRYKSAEFQFIGFDELTQFSETQFQYLFSRLRRKTIAAWIPLRMRTASNPGGTGHDWVKQRYFVEGLKYRRVVVPARLHDNPHVDQAEYERSLHELDPTTRAQLLAGDWDVRPPGLLFKREWFPIIEAAPAAPVAEVRYWDLAATLPDEGDDPDYTVGCKMQKLANGQFVISDLVRVRVNPQAVEQIIVQTAARDGRKCIVRMEQEPGASGKQVIDYYTRRVLPGYAFGGVRSTGKKDVRAMPLAAQAGAANVMLLQADWNSEFLNELVAFPDVTHDDQVDAAAGALEALTGVASFLFGGRADSKAIAA
jgi:predicted phage terminase large subunit-like protein